jgi:DNA polymerase III epsilon subunit-like protein
MKNPQNDAPNTSMRDISFAVVDFETTGVDPETDRIVQLAAIVVKALPNTFTAPSTFTVFLKQKYKAACLLKKLFENCGPLAREISSPHTMPVSILGFSMPNLRVWVWAVASITMSTLSLWLEKPMKHAHVVIR